MEATFELPTGSVILFSGKHSERTSAWHLKSHASKLISLRRNDTHTHTRLAFKVRARTPGGIQILEFGVRAFEAYERQHGLQCRRLAALRFAWWFRAAS